MEAARYEFIKLVAVKKPKHGGNPFSKKLMRQGCNTEPFVVFSDCAKGTFKLRQQIQAGDIPGKQCQSCPSCQLVMCYFDMVDFLFASFIFSHVYLHLMGFTFYCWYYNILLNNINSISTDEGIFLSRIA